MEGVDEVREEVEKVKNQNWGSEEISSREVKVSMGWEVEDGMRGKGDLNEGVVEEG